MYLRVYDGLRQLVSFSPGLRILLQVRGVRSAMEKSRKEGCAGVNVLACEQKNRWDGVIGEVGDVGPLSVHELCQARTFRVCRNGPRGYFPSRGITGIARLGRLLKCGFSHARCPGSDENANDR